MKPIALAPASQNAPIVEWFKLLPSADFPPPESMAANNGQQSMFKSTKIEIDHRIRWRTLENDARLSS
jgi:hypothetical protein